eukprot:1984743-Prymnesium_polylepis.1
MEQLHALSVVEAVAEGRIVSAADIECMRAAEECWRPLAAPALKALQRGGVSWVEALRRELFWRFRSERGSRPFLQALQEHREARKAAHAHEVKAVRANADRHRREIDAWRARCKRDGEEMIGQIAKYGIRPHDLMRDPDRLRDTVKRLIREGHGGGGSAASVQQGDALAEGARAPPQKRWSSQVFFSGDSMAEREAAHTAAQAAAEAAEAAAGAGSGEAALRVVAAAEVAT